MIPKSGEDYGRLRVIRRSPVTQRISEVDKDAFEGLYTRYQTPVYSLATFMLKQPVPAKEVIPDIFLNI